MTIPACHSYKVSLVVRYICVLLVTHIMAHTPAVELARPLAFGPVECVEDKADNVRQARRGEWRWDKHASSEQSRGFD